MLAAGTSGGLETGEIELTTPVRLELKRLQESWESWNRAYLKDDEEAARNTLVQLLSIAESLGMEKLSDQSVASAALAVRSASGGNIARARWAVDCARQLDDGRPEPEFASAHVERLAGNYFGAFLGSLKGHTKLFRLPFEGHVWKQNLGLGLLLLLVLTGGLFLVLLMGSQGADLFYDLGRLASPPLPRIGADVVAFVLLVWPLVLPGGVFWLALYWSALLFGYATVSQRAVLALGWVVIGLSPASVAFHQREVQKTLLPANRVLENLENRRLYGALFLDLDVLHNLLEESPAVTEIIADLHRDFGQWEHARVLYDGMVEANPGSPEVAAALNNIGVYHHRRGDHGTAVNFFKNAAEADPTLVEAWFNCSQAYNQSFNFTEGHDCLAEAKRVAPEKVELWEGSEGGTEGSVVPIDGGLRKAPQLREALTEAIGQESEPSSLHLLSRAHRSLALMGVLGALAVGVDLWRRKKGYPSSKFPGEPLFSDSRGMRTFLPGWGSTLKGNGPQAFGALLFPLAMIVIPLVRLWGYRTFVGYEARMDPVTILCALAILCFFATRFVRTLRSPDLG